MLLPTVKVKNGKDGFKIINKADFDEKVDSLFVEKAVIAKPVKALEKKDDAPVTKTASKRERKITTK